MESAGFLYVSYWLICDKIIVSNVTKYDLRVIKFVADYYNRSRFGGMVALDQREGRLALEDFELVVSVGNRFLLNSR
jgi:hypothetical protein